MNFLLDNWIWLLTAIASGAALMLPNLGKGGGADAVNPNGAVQLINREKAVVIDVCEPAEYQAGHVGGARNIPFGELEQKLPAAVKNKAVPVVLVCASGARSGRAVGIARKLGYEKAESLAGGLKAWRAADLPIEKA